MYTDYTAPFILIQDTGWTAEFYDWASLAAATRHLTIAEKHVVHAYTLVPVYRRVVLRNEWIVRDARGRVVTSDQINASISRDRLSRWFRRHSLQQHAASLGLPIPRTGKRGSRWRNWLRAPETLRINRERKAALVDDRELSDSYLIRGKIDSAPTRWDDLRRADNYDRSWKRHRKTQWKGK